MKRALAIGLVALLVAFAGCGMTSPAADRARDAQQTTTQQTESSPADTTPIQALLPDGYDRQGIVNATAATEAHVSALEASGYAVSYRYKTSHGNRTRVVNGSGPNRTWDMTTVGLGDRERTVVYQANDTQYTHVVYANGTARTESTANAYTHPDAVVGEGDLRSILRGLSLGTAQKMPNSSFVFYPIESYGNASVSRGHFMVMPTGQIRVIYLETADEKLVYTTLTGDVNPVHVPDWVSGAPTATEPTTAVTPTNTTASATTTTSAPTAEETTTATG